MEAMDIYIDRYVHVHIEQLHVDKMLLSDFVILLTYMYLNHTIVVAEPINTLSMLPLIQNGKALTKLKQ